MKRISAEILAVIAAAMIFSYFVGYRDGAYTKHHTQYNEVSHATAVVR